MSKKATKRKKNSLPFGNIEQGRAPNPAPFAGQSTLALLVNPSPPPKKKGSKMAAKKKGKKKRKKNQAEGAAKKPRKPSTKHAQVIVQVTPTTKSGKPKAKAETTTVSLQGTRTANGRKKRKKNSADARTMNGKKRKKRRNNGGYRAHNQAGIAAMMKQGFDVNSLQPLLGAAAAWAIPGIIYVIIPKETRDQMAKSLAEQSDVGNARARAVISGLALVAAWFSTNNVQALKPYRIPVLFGTALRFAFDLLGAFLPKDGLSGNVRAFFGLPDGNYDLQMGPTVKGNFVNFQPATVAGNFQRFTPTLSGWGQMNLIPQQMAPPQLQGFHSAQRAMSSSMSYGGVGASPMQSGSF